MAGHDLRDHKRETVISADALKIKRILDALRSRDVSSMGFEARILHRQRIEQLSVRYAAACSAAACANAAESPS